MSKNTRTNDESQVIVQYSLVLALVLIVQLSFERISFCHNSFADGETKPLYVLSLVPNSACGHAILSGHRIAQREINTMILENAGWAR